MEPFEESEIETCRTIIVGSGPTALGAKFRMPEAMILEAGTEVGGLSASARDRHGFTWDCGSHFQFSHYDYFDSVLDDCFSDSDWTRHRRSTCIHLCGRFVPYPFQLNLHRLSTADQIRCVAGLAKSRCLSRRSADFGEWILSTFGSGISDLFLTPYNQKIWSTPLSRMSCQWLGDRVAIPSLEDVLKSVVERQDSTTWGPNAHFRYPRSGGAGAVWRRIASRIPSDRIRYGERVVAIDCHARVLRTSCGRAYQYEKLVSTMPLKDLARCLGAPQELASVEDLVHTSVEVVGIGIRGQPPPDLGQFLWGYFPQADVPFYRLTLMSSLADSNVPEPGETWSLMAEIASSETRPLGYEEPVQSTLDALIQLGFVSSEDDVVSRWHKHLPYGYPVPTLERDDILSEALPWLEQHGIYSRGRFGAWKYEVSNQDHSFMQGVEVAERIMNGRPEVTLNDPDLVNGRRNPWPLPEYQPDFQTD